MPTFSPLVKELKPMLKWHKVFDKLYLAILKYLNTASIEDISHSDLLDLIDNTIPEDRDINTYLDFKGFVRSLTKPFWNE